MSKLYLHIGAHKTGTTSLQYILDKNKDAIFKEDNAFYPESCRFHYAHHRLAFAMKGMKDPAQGDVPNLDLEIKKLLNEVESIRKGGHDVKNIIVSSEEFFSAPEDKIQHLMAAVNDFFDEVEICAVIRRQDNQFISIYNQKVKSIGNRFFRPVGFFVNKPGALDDELFYGKHLNKWKINLKANGAMSIFLYEDYPDTAKELLAHFFGKGKEGLGSVKINKSVPVKYLEFVRHLKSKKINPEYMSDILVKAESFFSAECNESILAYEERVSILEYFEEDNALLAKLMSNSVPYGVSSLSERDKALVKKRLTVDDVISFFISMDEFGDK